MPANKRFSWNVLDAKADTSIVDVIRTTAVDGILDLARSTLAPKVRHRPVLQNLRLRTPLVTFPGCSATQAEGRLGGYRRLSSRYQTRVHLPSATG
jgi:hypothetical protein